MGLDDTSIVSYGSSAGGFGAMRFTADVPGSSCIAINPQIILEERNSKTRRNYFRHCFNGLTNSDIFLNFHSRFDLRTHVESFKKSRLIYLQNRVDTEHVDLHFTPFCAAMGADPCENLDSGAFRRVLFDHEDGHAKAETPEAFACAMSILQSNLKL